MNPRPQPAATIPHPLPTRDRDLRDTLVTAAVLFGGFLAVYYATRQQNLSTYHDAVTHLRSILDGVGPHPHHLIFRWLVRGWLWCTGSLTAAPRLAAASAATLSGLFGADVVALAFLLLRWRFGLSRPCACIGAALVGFSYGPWLHSTVIGLYTMPLVPLLACLLLMTGDQTWPGTYAIVGALHAFMVLVHQAYVLFAVVVLFAAWTASYDPIFRRRCMLAYVTTFGVLVFVPYVLVALTVERVRSVAGFVHWITTYAHEGYWHLPGPTAFVKAAIGFTRVFFGMLFVFAIPAGRAFVEGMVRHRLEDEAFVVHDVSPALASALLAIMGCGIILMVALLVANWSGWRRVWAGHRRAAALVGGTFAVFSVFFLTWQPDMLDYWMPQLIMVWVLWSAVVLRPDRNVAARAWASCLVGATLVIANGLGGIRQLGWPHYDYFHACTTAAGAHLERDAVILVENEYLADYLELFLGVTVQHMLFPGGDDPRATEPTRLASSLAAEAARRGAPISAYVVGTGVPEPLRAAATTPPRALVERPCEVWQLALAADASQR